jgi:hypothetical protein
VVSSSSTRRAAKLAQKGKGKKVRFQGGTLFPLVVAVVVVIGMGLIVYSRSSVPEADASPPTIDDHWHAAYGFKLCDEDWRTLDGNKETQGDPGFQQYALTGVHSHDDGVIHWHPFTATSVGRRAKLGVFLDVYGVELDDDSLRFPEEQGGDEFIEGETQCDGEDAELKVVVWDSFSDTDDGTTYISDFDDIRIDQDGMVFSIAFVPPGTEVEKPPWAVDLDELGAADQGQVEPQPGSSVAGASTVPSGSSAPASTAPAGSAPSTGSTSPAAPASSSPPTTTG